MLPRFNLFIEGKTLLIQRKTPMWNMRRCYEKERRWDLSRWQQTSHQSLLCWHSQSDSNAQFLKKMKKLYWGNQSGWYEPALQMRESIGPCKNASAWELISRYLWLHGILYYPSVNLYNWGLVWYISWSGQKKKLAKRDSMQKILSCLIPARYPTAEKPFCLHLCTISTRACSSDGCAVRNIRFFVGSYASNSTMFEKPD